ncbi:MAG: TA system VapC family ribonuclease toxin [Terriglobales bacterium]
MIFLLDVNALIAAGFRAHTFHPRVQAWLAQQTEPKLATCSITELGFVRVLSQSTAYGLSVDRARELLQQVQMREPSRFRFLPDACRIAGLPGWVRSPKQITDGHLLQLARVHGAELATLDHRIRSAHRIP